MKLAKNRHFLPGCLLFCLLAGCSTPHPTGNFDRTEAVKARINLALAYLERHDFPKAKENIDKALAHDENDYLPHSVLAYYYQQTGDLKSAETAYQTALQYSQKFSAGGKARPDVQNNYGTFLCKQGKFEQAYQQFDAALESTQPYYHQADTLENIILCARQQPNATKAANAQAQLEKLDKARAEKLKF